MKYSLGIVGSFVLSAAVVAGFSTIVAADEVVSLRGDKSLFAKEVVASTKVYLGAKPGKQKVYGRAWDSAPPQVSHTLDKMTVNKNKNTCVECHDRDTYEMAEAPVMSDSHYKDRDGKALSQFYQGRYNCTQCHVPMVDARPIVANTFQGIPYVAKKKTIVRKKKMDDLF